MFADAYQMTGRHTRASLQSHRSSSCNSGASPFKPMRCASLTFPEDTIDCATTRVCLIYWRRFIWSCPLDEAKATINAYLHSLLSVVLDGEKARGKGGVLYIDPALTMRYVSPEDLLQEINRCDTSFVGHLKDVVCVQSEKGRVVIFELENGVDGSGTIWSVSREPAAAAGPGGWYHEPSVRQKISLRGGAPVACD